MSETDWTHNCAFEGVNKTSVRSHNRHNGHAKYLREFKSKTAAKTAIRKLHTAYKKKKASKNQRRPWTAQETERLKALVIQGGTWEHIAALLGGGRTVNMMRLKYYKIKDRL